MSEFKKIQKLFHKFDSVNYPGNNTERMALGVAEEAGELCHHVLKRAQELGKKKKHNEEIKDALADITVFSMQIASFEGFDWEDNFLKVAKKVLKRNRKERQEYYNKK